MKNSCEITDLKNQTGLSNSEMSEVKKICLANSNIEKIVLFGSRAKKTWKPRSDIDLCLFGENASYHDVAVISFKLNEETLFPYHFDILLWNEIQNKEISKHILRCGIVL